MRTFRIFLILTLLAIVTVSWTQQKVSSKSIASAEEQTDDLNRYKGIDKRWNLNLSMPTTTPEITKEQAIATAKKSLGEKSVIRIEAFYAKAHNGSLKGDFWIVIVKRWQGAILNKGYGESYFGPTEELAFVYPNGKLEGTAHGVMLPEDQLNEEIQRKLREEVVESTGLAFSNATISDLVVIGHWARGRYTDLHNRKPTQVVLKKTNLKWEIIATGDRLTHNDYPQSPPEIWSTKN